MTGTADEQKPLVDVEQPEQKTSEKEKDVSPSAASEQTATSPEATSKATEAEKPTASAEEPAAATMKRAADEQSDGHAAAKKQKLTKEAEIKKQVEYYFSDGNLSRDHFFHGKISEDAEGLVDLTLVMNCNKIKSGLNVTDVKQIVDAVSASNAVECQEVSGVWRIKRKDGKATLPKLDKLRPTGGKGEGKGGKGKGSWGMRQVSAEQMDKFHSSNQFHSEVHRAGPFLTVRNIPEDLSWQEVKQAVSKLTKRANEEKKVTCRVLSSTKVVHRDQHNKLTVPEQVEKKPGEAGKKEGANAGEGAQAQAEASKVDKEDAGKRDLQGQERVVVAGVLGFAGDLTYWKGVNTIKVEYRQQEENKQPAPVELPLEVVVEPGLLAQCVNLLPKEMCDRRQREARKFNPPASKSTKIVIGKKGDPQLGFEFPHLMALKKQVKEIQTSRSDGERLDPKGRDFMLVSMLLQAHPRGAEKKANMVGIKVDVSSHGGNRCFFVVQKAAGGTGEKLEDFSMIKIFAELEANAEKCVGAVADVMTTADGGASSPSAGAEEKKESATSSIADGSAEPAKEAAAAEPAKPAEEKKDVEAEKK
eukprot:g14828.t1